MEELASVVPIAAASKIDVSAMAWKRGPTLVALTRGTRQDNPDTRRKRDSAILRKVELKSAGCARDSGHDSSPAWLGR
jgi:hypothetical protein